MSGWYIATDWMVPHQTWEEDGTSDDTSETYHFHLAENHVFSCNTWCLKIPKCPTTTPHRVTIGASPSDCGPTSYKDVYFKLTEGSSTEIVPSHDQNFPNPFGAASLFRTAIPFSTTSDGTVVIRVLDRSGVPVLTESQDVLGAGRHYFYFSGSELPSGTYFYSIVSSEGKVLTSKTMLLVK